MIPQICKFAIRLQIFISQPWRNLERSLSVVEVKGGETFSKDYLKNLSSFVNESTSLKIKKYLIHPEAKATKIQDISVLSWEDLPSELIKPFSL